MSQEHRLGRVPLTVACFLPAFAPWQRRVTQTRSCCVCSTDLLFPTSRGRTSLVLVTPPYSRDKASFVKGSSFSVPGLKDVCGRHSPSGIKDPLLQPHTSGTGSGPPSAPGGRKPPCPAPGQPTSAGWSVWGYSLLAPVPQLRKTSEGSSHLQDIPRWAKEGSTENSALLGGSFCPHLHGQ